MIEEPASPDVVAQAIAQARQAIAKASPPRPTEPPRTQRQPVPALPPGEALQSLLDALRDTRRALAALEAALLDYAPTEPSTQPEEGTSHHD